MSEQFQPECPECGRVGVQEEQVVPVSINIEEIVLGDLFGNIATTFRCNICQEEFIVQYMSVPPVKK